jgi:hypothetical protein
MARRDRGGLLVTVCALALGSLAPGCAEPTSDTASLRALVDAGDYRAVLAALGDGLAHDAEGADARGDAQAAADDDGPAAAEAFERRKLFVLAHAGLGNCQPALDLLEDPEVGAEAREVAQVARRAADLAAEEAVAASADLWWADDTLTAEQAQQLGVKLEASVCVLEQAQQRFPPAAASIEPRVVELRTHAESLRGFVSSGGDYLTHYGISCIFQ